MTEQKDYRLQIAQALKRHQRTIPQQAARVGLNKGTLYLYLMGKTQNMNPKNLKRLLDDLEIKSDIS